MAIFNCTCINNRRLELQNKQRTENSDNNNICHLLNGFQKSDIYNEKQEYMLTLSHKCFTTWNF